MGRGRLLRTIAYHEAGHAVAAMELGESVKRVSIVPTKRHSGRVHLLNDKQERLLQSHSPSMRKVVELYETDIKIRLAGVIAELILNGKGKTDPRFSSTDLNYAWELSLILALNNRKQADSRLGRLWRHIKRLLYRRSVWNKVELVAANLLERKTLTKREVEGLCRKRRRIGR